MFRVLSLFFLKERCLLIEKKIRDSRDICASRHRFVELLSKKTTKREEEEEEERERLSKKKNIMVKLDDCARFGRSSVSRRIGHRRDLI